MNVKTFTGTSTNLVIAQIKEEMGTDAVILSTRELKQNGKKIYEITAGIDRQANIPNNIKSNKAYPDFNDWQKDWLQMKEHLYALMQDSISLDKLSPRARVAVDYLQKEGTNDHIIVEIYRKLLDRPNASPLHLLSELMPTKSYDLTNYPEHIQIVCGPAGSGKTTTALRLAMRAKKANHDLNISFINTDITRANGRLILKHWAELSNFNYSEASDIRSMREALIANQQADIIFVDLASLSLQENLNKKLASLGLLKVNACSHLVISPSYNNLQAIKYIEMYKDVSSLILTKLDEFNSFGSLINFCVDSLVPISAISYGSEIKDSLRPCCNEDIWKLIFKKELVKQAENVPIRNE